MPFALRADISNEKEVMHLFERIDTTVGKLSALVNNAGIIESQSRLVDMNGSVL